MAEGLDVPGFIPARQSDTQRLRRIERVPGVDPHLQGRHEAEGLEGGTRLRLALRSEIELGYIVVRASHHGHDIAGGSFDCHKCGRGIALPVKGGGDGFLRQALVVGVDSSLNGEPAFEHGVAAEHVNQLLPYECHHVGFLHGHEGGTLGETQGLVNGLVVLGLVDEIVFEHVIQDLAATGQRGRGIEPGIVHAGGLHQACEQRRLRQSQAGRVLVEVRAGGSLYTVGIGTEVDRVQILVEYLVFGHLLFQLPGEEHLVDFALDRDV
ncbi:MAG: hypothetical protein BWY79_01553 [Actinobacteria bacterium ADurb.Bin444]|nr:MAG: hypothetical protein BWY79_01553 [Actinobacteria bacterium ADurb.Bin444]